MAHIIFDSTYAPTGFLIVGEGHNYRDPSHSTLIQFESDVRGVAESLGYRESADQSPVDFLVEREGERFGALDEYLQA